ncbi:glycine cleavage system protein GcvH [Desulfovibrio sp. OttesenSCG-928-C06]|nr:glycine cleavage system protein GcvH [Desulfovibrio sp. OttesenSCG-928-C06]
MTTTQLNYPEDLLYTDEHIWARQVGDLIEVGISDFAQDQLTEIAYIDLPKAGEFFEAGQDFGTVESIKSVNSLYCPYSGEVAEVNSELDSAPTIVNVDPYGKGWMIRLRPKLPAETVELLSAADYRAFLARS